MTIARLILLIAVLTCSLQAQAQGPAGLRCDGFDTTNFGDTTPRAILSTCNVIAGPAGIIIAIPTAEVTCAATEAVQMFVGTGTSPINGSNFLASASGGVLTVTSNVPGFGPADPPTTSNPGGGGPPFTIQTGQTLVPGSGATSFTPTPITGQLTSTETAGALGGTGTYSIANGALSIPGGTNLYTLNAVPGGVTNMMLSPKRQNACNNGFIITAVSGNFQGTPGAQYWIGVSIATNVAADEATWNNNGIVILTY